MTQEFPNIVSIVNNITTRRAGVSTGEEQLVLFGKDRINEKLGDFEYMISADSFFQTNRILPSPYPKYYSTRKGWDDVWVKTKPKFASKVLKGLSKLDVGQEVIEKGLSKLGTKYGAAAFTGPAAGILAFYETLVLAADVANAATKAMDKDVDFFDNFGEIDDKYSITYKLTNLQTYKLTNFTHLQTYKLT